MFKIEYKKNPTTIEVNSIMSLHNIGMHEEAFDRCKNFFIKYPNSPLLYNILIIFLILLQLLPKKRLIKFIKML